MQASSNSNSSKVSFKLYEAISNLYQGHAKISSIAILHPNATRAVSNDRGGFSDIQFFTNHPTVMISFSLPPPYALQMLSSIFSRTIFRSLMKIL